MKTNMLKAGFFIAASVLSSHSFAASQLATGTLFGVKVGESLNLPAADLKSLGNGVYMFRAAEKPSDIEAVHVSVTPITRTVWKVEGVSDFATEAQMRAFVAKYARSLPEAGPEFALKPSPYPDTPVELFSGDWRLEIRVRDLKKYGRPGGYGVVIELTRAGLFFQFASERKEAQRGK